MDTLLLKKSNIQNLITMKEAIEICDKTFKDMGKGTTINPAKLGLDLGESSKFPPYEGFMNAMPAYVGWLDTAGIKWAGGFLGERKKMGLPYITSMILLINPKLGNFTAVMDGSYITSLRTGAQTAVALKYMKRTKCISVGLYGAGMQGQTQIMALSEVYDIEKLIVYDINKEAAIAFSKKMRNYVNGHIVIANIPKEAAQADIIICVTQSKNKFLKNEWVHSGTIVFPLGSYQECEDELILNADKILVDHIDQSLHRGDLKELHSNGKISFEDIYATIGELSVKKNKEAFHMESQSQRILCVLIGMGAMDITLAKYVYDKAILNHLGEHFDFVD